jgi:hypothetical protein
MECVSNPDGDRVRSNRPAHFFAAYTTMPSGSCCSGQLLRQTRAKFGIMRSKRLHKAGFLPAVTAFLFC